jgi:hypothetical protein
MEHRRTVNYDPTWFQRRYGLTRHDQDRLSISSKMRPVSPSDDHGGRLGDLGAGLGSRGGRLVGESSDARPKCLARSG